MIAWAIKSDCVQPGSFSTFGSEECGVSCEAGWCLASVGLPWDGCLCCRLVLEHGLMVKTGDQGTSKVTKTSHIDQRKLQVQPRLTEWGNKLHLSMGDVQNHFGQRVDREK